MTIVDETIENMKLYQNIQWCSKYPSLQTFENDILNENLYVFDNKGICIAFIVIDMNEPEPYNGLKWHSNLPHLNIHRFAVSDSYKNKGIASQLLKYADTLAKNKQIKYIKIDTNSKNIPMINLLLKNKYIETDRVFFRNIIDEFICFDKIL